MVDETTLFVMDLKKKSREKFKIPKQLKDLTQYIKIKAILMNQEIKFLVFKYRDNEDRRLIF